MNRKLEILALLDQADIGYFLHEHAPVRTMDDCLSIAGIDWNAVEMPKNVFLCNRQQTAFYLMLLPHGAPFRTAQVSKALGVSRLSFAPDALLPEFLGLQAGAVSPLGLVFDTQKRVQLVIDERLRGLPWLAFHPCDSRATVVLSAEAFFEKLLPGIGRAPVWADTRGETEP